MTIDIKISIALDNAFKRDRQSGKKLSDGLAQLLVLLLTLLSLNGQAQTADHYLLSERIIERVANGRTDGRGHLRIYGPKGPAQGHVVLVPSLGRGVEDFTEIYGSSLTSELARHDFCVVLLQPRGIGSSARGQGSRNRRLSVFAEDIRGALDEIGVAQAHIAGHAFGNRVARAFATQFPERVQDVTLLAAGGQRPLSPEQAQVLTGIFSSDTPEQRRPLVARAFFADPEQADIWLDGWHPEAATLQIEAALQPDVDFRRAGEKPLLILQPAQDFIAPSGSAGKLLKRELGELATYRQVSNSGHALLPEQPVVVAQQLIAFISLRSAPAGAGPVYCLPDAAHSPLQ